MGVDGRKGSFSSLKLFLKPENLKRDQIETWIKIEGIIFIKETIAKAN